MGSILKANFTPTPEEIYQATQALQAKWKPCDFQRRAGSSKPKGIAFQIINVSDYQDVIDLSEER